MIQIKDILIPTDFTGTYSAALGHATMLADRFDARLIMLHVAAADAPHEPAHFPAVEPEKDEVEQEVEQQASEIAGLAPDRELRVKRVIRSHQDPAVEIMNYAAEKNVDLIVVGTRGRTGFSHLIVGSVAETVIRDAKSPVIAVRVCDTSEEVMPYLNILAPVDFSADSEKALRYAWTLAELFEANLQMLHVIDLPVYPEHYAVNIDLSEQFGHELALRSHEQMEKLAAPYAGTNVRYKTHVETGRAYSEIVEFAQTHDTDLIVMGTRGLSRLENFLLGGTTAKVVRHASCPVLTVKLEEKDFVGLMQPDLSAGLAEAL